MTPDREMLYRMKCAVDAGKPFTNYGIFIAYVNGILARSIEKSQCRRKIWKTEFAKLQII